MEKTVSVIKSLKKGNFILIDGVPCRVDSVSVSKSGKHGASKCRIEAIGLLDGRRRSLVKPSDDTVEVPIVNRKNGQLLAIVGDKAQIMDLTDYSTFEVNIPEEMKGKLKEGSEITYYEMMGVKTIKELR